MTLEEKKKALELELFRLKSKVEALDSEAMKRAEQILDVDLPSVEKEIASAVKYSTLINRINDQHGKKDSVGVHAQGKSLGAHVAKSFEKDAGYIKGDRVQFTAPAFKAAEDPISSNSDIIDQVHDVRKMVVPGNRRPLTVASLFGQETTNAAAVTYFVEGETEGEVTSVAEGGLKPSIRMETEPVTDPVKKIAAVYKETDELLDDLPWLASSLDNRAMYLLQVEEEDQLLNGSGSGADITGVLNRTGLQAESEEASDDSAPDAIFRAMTKVATGSNYTADGIVINPTDYQAIRLSKDANGQYYGGGFFTGAYGNSGEAINPPLWGVRTVVTPAIASGTVLVGAFRSAAAIIRRKGITVNVTNSNEDDFKYNRIAIRIEERFALAVRTPAAFVKVTLQSN